MSASPTFGLSAAAVILCLSWAGSAQARRSYLGDIPNGAQADCVACHIGGGSGPRNAFGTDYASAGGAWARLYALDSDGDGQSNGLELGDPCGTWTPRAVPSRTDSLANPGLSTSLTSATSPGCGAMVDAGVPPSDASVEHVEASTIDPSDYPNTNVGSGCSVSPVPGPRSGLFWFTLLGFVLLRLRRSHQRRRQLRRRQQWGGWQSVRSAAPARTAASVAAAAATTREASSGALSDIDGVAFGAADLGISINRHVATSERGALIGSDGDTSGANGCRCGGCQNDEEGKHRVAHGSLNSMICVIRKHSCVLICASVFVFSSGCVTQDPTFIPLPPRDMFDSDVMPILARDCAFPACHGDMARAFVVYAPGRTRRDPATDPWAVLTAEESESNYQRALSMLVGPGSAARTLLVDKPLSTAVGGGFHEGVDARGLDVYATRDDAGYLALLAWAREALAARR